MVWREGFVVWGVGEGMSLEACDMMIRARRREMPNVFGFPIQTAYKSRLIPM